MLKSLKSVSKPPALSRSNDSDATRANILKVAAREFSDKGVSEGQFRTDLDPIDLHATISALSFYNVSNRDTFAVNFGRDMAAPEALAKRRQQVIELVLAYVMSTPKP